MASRAQRSARRSERPSSKPLFVVAGLLMSAALGAVLTTGTVPTPVHHSHPIHSIVVTRIDRPGSGTSTKLWL